MFIKNLHQNKDGMAMHTQAILITITHQNKH